MTQKTSSSFTICHIYAFEINYFPVLLSVRALLARSPKCNKRKVVSGSRVTLPENFTYKPGLSFNPLARVGEDTSSGPQTKHQRKKHADVFRHTMDIANPRCLKVNKYHGKYTRKYISNTLDNQEVENVNELTFLDSKVCLFKN